MSRSLKVTAILVVLLSAAACSEKPQPANETARKQPTGEENTGKTTAKASAAHENDKRGETAEVSAEGLVRKLADFFMKAKTVEVREQLVVHVKMQGMDNKMTATRTLVAEKPNHIAVRTEGGMMGVNLVSDGEKLFTYVPAMKTYTEQAAPGSISEIMSDPMMMGMLGSSGPFVLHLLADNPYEQLMEGVTESKNLGRETLDGVDVHHLQFKQEQFDWEMWINAHGDPLIRRVSMDMTKAMAQADNAFQDRELKATFVSSFTDWRLDKPVDAKEFVFTPPEGAQKSESLFDAFAGGTEELSPLLGEAAPVFDLELLAGGRTNLKDHAGKDVVMLDFWATWCGPCVEELPLLAEVAHEYKDKQVVFFAVNQGEEPQEIREFLKEKALDVTVALDPEGDTGDRYGVDGIPTLVLIDKAGVVQVVHVGYSSNIKSILRQELDDLLAGKNLAEEALREHAEQETAAAEPKGLEAVWSHEGRYLAVAADPKQNEVLVLQSDGLCERLNAAGEKQGSFQTERKISLLRPANFTPSEKSELIGFGHWGDSVAAFSSDGTKLWIESGGQGIDDVWAADLDGDGRDEVIVGYNGATGLHVFDNDGARRWKYTDIGNVWHVTAGDVTGDGNTEVVTTSASGQVHVFDAEGKPVKNLDPGVYASMVRVGRVAADDKAETIFVVGSGSRGEQVVAMDGDGKEFWTIDLPGNASHCDSMAIAPKSTWAAVGLRGGLVNVIDLAEGKIIATAIEQGETPEVSWTIDPESNKPLLLVATRRAIHAYRVQPVEDNGSVDENADVDP